MVTSAASMKHVDVSSNEKAFIQKLQAIAESDAKDSSSSKLTFRVLTDEVNTTDVNAQISAARKIKDGVFFGVGTLSTMQLIAVAEARFAVLLDIMPETVKFNQFVLQKLSNSAKREDVIQAVRDYVSDMRGHNFARDLITQLSVIDSSVDSPFSNEKHYQYLVNMAKENRVVCIKGDILNTDIIERISQCVKESGYHFSLVYLSNLENCCPSEARSDQLTKLNRTITPLIEAETIIVDTHIERVPHKGYSRGVAKSSRCMHYGVHPQTNTSYAMGHPATATEKASSKIDSGKS